jgi:hypothetical protein
MPCRALYAAEIAAVSGLAARPWLNIRFDRQAVVRLRPLAIETAVHADRGNTD